MPPARTLRSAERETFDDRRAHARDTGPGQPRSEASVTVAASPSPETVAPARTTWLREHAGRVLLIVGAVAACAIALWYLVFDKAVTVYPVLRSDLAQSVVATGQVITPQRTSIASEVTGRVARVPVAEGQTVRKGQVLIELDQADELAALAQARAALAQADAKVAHFGRSALPIAEQSLAQARSNLTQAERAYQRTGDLVASGFVSPAQLDDARRNLEVAQSQVRAAELQAATAGPGGSDLAVAETARREARAAIAVADAKLASTIIRAPADGTLIARSVEPGDVAQSGKELLVLAPSGETQIIVNIDEKHLGKLAAGKKALASADAFPGETFEAELFYVNPGVDPVRGSVQVKLRVPDPPSYLRQDMSVSVDIEVARRNDVVVVPADALRDAGTPHPWVMVVRNGVTERQPVTLGMRGDSAAEVTAGLFPGDVVVPAGNARVAAGAHVRPTTSADADKR